MDDKFAKAAGLLPLSIGLFVIGMILNNSDAGVAAYALQGTGIVLMIVFIVLAAAEMNRKKGK